LILHLSFAVMLGFAAFKKGRKKKMGKNYDFWNTKHIDTRSKRRRGRKRKGGKGREVIRTREKTTTGRRGRERKGKERGGSREEKRNFSINFFSRARDAQLAERKKKKKKKGRKRGGGENAATPSITAKADLEKEKKKTGKKQVPHN